MDRRVKHNQTVTKSPDKAKAAALAKLKYGTLLQKKNSETLWEEEESGKLSRIGNLTTASQGEGAHVKLDKPAPVNHPAALEGTAKLAVGVKGVARHAC